MTSDAQRLLPEDVPTRISLARLETASKETTQEDRDRVLAFVAANLWPESALNAHIRAQHEALCRDCPLRQAAALQPPKTGLRAIDINTVVRGVLWIIAALVFVIAYVIGAPLPFIGTGGQSGD